jgi:hypothetical protein
LADEPKSATEPEVMMEGGEVTQVITRPPPGGRPAGINVSLGFNYESKTANILRETAIHEPGLTTGGFTTRLMNVAKYSSTETRLVPRVDVAIWHDIGVYFRLPIILNYSQNLGDLNGTQGREGVVLQGAPGETLFGLPFKAPDRSGLEYLAAGIDLDILSEARDRTKPTWLFGIEGRFSIGTPMHACNPNPKAGQVNCADPSDINRNGQPDGAFEGTGFSTRSPGVTRGTIGLEGHTIMSKRFKYVEPYGGFAALFEFQQNSSDYGLTDLEGSLVNHPPFVGSMILGLMVIPWENREKFSRLTFDARLTGRYHSEGRDYSELFDALGSSDAASLRQPQWAKYMANPSYNAGSTDQNKKIYSVIDPSSQKTYFTGLSDVAAYGSYRGSLAVTWQAASLFKLQVGFGFKHDQSHNISQDQPCNPDLNGDDTKAGPCSTKTSNPPKATGIPNPNYRPTVNGVGRRFYVDSSNTFDVFASAVLMF